MEDNPKIPSRIRSWALSCCLALPWAIALVLMLANHNSGWVAWGDLVSAIAFACVAALVLATLPALLIRDPVRCAAVAASALMTFMLLGHVQIFLANYGMSRRAALISVALLGSVSLLAMILFILKARRQLVHGMVMWIGASGVIVFGWATLSRCISAVSASTNPTKPSIDIVVRPSFRQRDLPDVYYIILDKYLRDDKLKEICKFDNAPFIAQLEKRGFKIPKNPRSNYFLTALSLASSLSLDYLGDRLSGGPQEKDPQSFAVPFRLIAENHFMRCMSSVGFETHSYGTWYIGTETCPAAQVQHRMEGAIELSEFQYLFLRTTAFGLWHSVFYQSKIGLAQRTIQQFRTVADVGRLAQPTFFFSHMIIPHPPYVFDREAKPLASEGEGREGYVAQVQAANILVLDMIDRLLSSSSIPPVIILQGDHGTEFLADQGDDVTFHRERAAIFCAVLGPDALTSRLYDGITPVNITRAVVDYFCGGNFPPLEDLTFASWGDHPFRFTDVTKEVSR